jgi:monofunctional biosynthetic peptidoglycan transglycosylase
MNRFLRHALRLLMLIVVSGLSLQLYFLGRVALMAVVDPQSTAFQRSEISRLVRERHELPWRQDWVAGKLISPQLKRAVIASEDAGFTEHGGVEWDALEKAWERNQQAQARAERQNQRQEKRQAARPNAAPAKRVQPRIVGGSTITQQLAKNLFLASEQSLLRKGQEVAITFMLEALLPKERILEIYLNNVEWGEGVFGAEAAAQHYFHVPAAGLTAPTAARLAVMLPAPKKFEKRPASPYMMSRAAVIQSRMGAVDLP